jgi:hypothetical protein
MSAFFKGGIFKGGRSLASNYLYWLWHCPIPRIPFPWQPFSLAPFQILKPNGLLGCRELKKACGIFLPKIF